MKRKRKTKFEREIEIKILGMQVSVLKSKGYGVCRDVGALYKNIKETIKKNCDRTVFKFAYTEGLIFCLLKYKKYKNKRRK